MRTERQPMPNTEHPTPDTQGSTLDVVLDGLAVLWLVIVGVQYALVLLLPGPPDLSATYPPLLAGIVIAGIIRWRLRRRQR
jgi:hypothetical protein